MNPEQNKQPNQVNQPPQTEPTNQPIVTPPFEPTIIQPAPAAQPLDTAAAPQQPPITATAQPMQTPLPITQPVPATNTDQKSKKPFVIAGIAVVIIILIVGGAIGYSQFGSVRVLDPGHDVKVDDFSFDGARSDLEESDATESENNSEYATISMNKRDTERKYNLSKIAALISEYQANNNGKIPIDAQTAKQAIYAYQQDSISDPLSNKEYVIIAYSPTKGDTIEIQYAPQQTCTGTGLAPSTSRSFALRGYLESGELVCLSS